MLVAVSSREADDGATSCVSGTDIGDGHLSTCGDNNGGDDGVTHGVRGDVLDGSSCSGGGGGDVTVGARVTGGSVDGGPNIDSIDGGGIDGGATDSGMCNGSPNIRISGVGTALIQRSSPPTENAGVAGQLLPFAATTVILVVARVIARTSASANSIVGEGISMGAIGDGVAVIVRSLSSGQRDSVCEAVPNSVLLKRIAPSHSFSDFLTISSPNIGVTMRSRESGRRTSLSTTTNEL